jgi:hypothetical protein
MRSVQSAVPTLCLANSRSHPHPGIEFEAMRPSNCLFLSESLTLTLFRPLPPLILRLHCYAHSDISGCFPGPVSANIHSSNGHLKSGPGRHHAPAEVISGRKGATGCCVALDDGPWPQTIPCPSVSRLLGWLSDESDGSETRWFYN